MLERVVTQAEDFPGTEEPFIIKDHFVKGFNPHIGYVGENVKKFFYSFIIPPTPPCAVSGHILAEEVSCQVLVQKFGRCDALSLVVGWHYLQKQPNGEDGFLLTDGRTNIFLDCGFSIGFFWHKGGWSIRAYPKNAEKPRNWFVGNQVVLID